MTADIEYLNEVLIKERDELKEELAKKQNQLDKMVEQLKEFSKTYLKWQVPFGRPGDSKMIEVLIHKNVYEEEILAYNMLYDKVSKAISNEVSQNNNVNKDINKEDGIINI